MDYKDLPNDPEELIELYLQTQKDFCQLEERYERILETVAQLRRYEKRESFEDWAGLMNILWDRHQIGYPPVFGKVDDPFQLRAGEISRWFQFSFSDLAGLPKSVREDLFSKQEIVAMDGITKLREEAFEKYEILSCISTKAALEGVKLPKNATKELTGTILQGRHWPDEELQKPSVEQTPVERKKKAVPESVATRRAIAKAILASNPNTKGKNLDLLTCQTLDRVRVDLLAAWRNQHKIRSWENGYKHPKVKPLIHKMLSDDRKS